jgi:tRNA threonylcarbamoyladenosine modification (KEOPS) complex  Pcc1 subunit
VNKGFSLKLNLFFENERKARIVFFSLHPEWKHAKRKRSESKIKVKKGILSINIKASDATALRASIASFLKPVILSKKLIEGRC